MQSGSIAAMSRKPCSIVVRADLCSGCRACEVACVAAHEGRFGTATARIRVTKIEPMGMDAPRVCRQCAHAPCQTACPTGALSRSEKTTAILVNAERCIGCYACVDACPLGVVIQHPVTSTVLICDLCDGAPACVRRCATGAISHSKVGTGSWQRPERLRGEPATEGLGK